MKTPFENLMHPIAIEAVSLNNSPFILMLVAKCIHEGLGMVELFERRWNDKYKKENKTSKVHKMDLQIQKHLIKAGCH